MKKVLVVLLCLCCFMGTAVSADNVYDTLEQVMQKFGAETTDDLSVLQFYKNYNRIDQKYKPRLASAIRAGLLAPVNGLLAPESDDLTSIKNGLASYALKDPKYKLVAGQYSQYKIGGAIIGLNTLLLDELDETNVFTAIVDKSNNVVAAWQAGEVRLPTVYRAKVYIKDNDMLVLTDLERSSYDMWIDESKGGFTELNVANSNMHQMTDEDINLNYMDREVYFIADSYKNEILPLYFKRGE